MHGGRRVVTIAVAALALAVVAGCSAGPAPTAGPPTATRTRPPGSHLVSGSVVSEQGATWVVRPTTGPVVTVTLTPGTTFGRTRQPMTAAQFPVGSTVRVAGTEQGTTVVARRVLPPLGTRPGQPATTSTTAPAPAPAAAPPAPSAPDPAVAAAAVAAADTAAAQHAGVEMGVAVEPRAGGPVTLGARGATPFESASVVKLFTIVDILHRAETGAEGLSPDDPDDIYRALTASDDDAMDGLWEAHGGVATIDDVIPLVGLQDTSPPADTSEWGLMRTSPRDVLAVWRYATTQLDPADRAMITTALSASSVDGTDGFDQSFGLLAEPRPSGVEAKQGWMSDGDLFLHTTGIPSATSPYVVAVLTEQPPSQSWDETRTIVDQVTTALTGTLAAAP